MSEASNMVSQLLHLMAARSFCETTTIAEFIKKAHKHGFEVVVQRQNSEQLTTTTPEQSNTPAPPPREYTIPAKVMLQRAIRTGKKFASAFTDSARAGLEYYVWWDGSQFVGSLTGKAPWRIDQFSTKALSAKWREVDENDTN